MPLARIELAFPAPEAGARSVKLQRPFDKLRVNLAERVGFGPTRVLLPYRFSGAASSTTPAPFLHGRKPMVFFQKLSRFVIFWFFRQSCQKI